jgi:D-3-phosphoglycerate dehydrogenase / 2-oxoglutarate reductase
LRAVFVDANETLAAVMEHHLGRRNNIDIAINRDPDVKSAQLPGILNGAEIAIVDHTYLPTDIARACETLRHVVFLGTGARSYMSPEELGGLGIAVHTIKGYADTAVAECAFALMWAAAKCLAPMDRGIRAGRWIRTDGVQLTGKTLGLIGFGGIAAELARLASGAGMTVLAWNRTPKTLLSKTHISKTHPDVRFSDLDDVLASSDVVSLHLLLTDETKNFLSRERIAQMKRGAMLVNTARGALVDERAMIDALRSGHLQHAGLDVFAIEPLPEGHPLTSLENVTLSAHSAFRTPEASHNLIEAALDHYARIAGAGI